MIAHSNRECDNKHQVVQRNSGLIGFFFFPISANLSFSVDYVEHALATLNNIISVKLEPC